MAFAVPFYSRQQVNAAGVTIINTPREKIWISAEITRAYFEALEIVNNWRAAHSGPLLSMRMLLTRQAESVDQNALIAQRIKRLSSIEAKLTRFRTMKLSQMQDIGGCRAIVGSVSDVKALAENFQKSRTKSVFDHMDDICLGPSNFWISGNTSHL